MTKKLIAVVMIICIGITALTGCGKKTVSKAVLKNDMEKTEINDKACQKMIRSRIGVHMCTHLRRLMADIII